MSNARAFWATAKRELLIRCRYPDWLVAMLLWPILMPTFTVFATQALAGPDNSGGEIFAEIAGTSDYIGFVFIGIVMWSWLNTVLWQVGATLRTEQRRGTLESNWVTPASRLAIMFGSGLTNMISSLMTVAVSLIFCKLVWHMNLTFSPLLGLVFLLSTAAIYGLGLIFASLVLLVRELNSAVNFVRGMFMVFCGITYPISVMPHWMADRRERPTAHLLHSSHPRDWACRCRLQRCIRLILDSLRLCGISHSRRVYALHF